MINIKSIRCGLAFSPYLLEGLRSYVETGRANPCVVKQAASGLILRSEDELIIHYQNREAALNREAARHYLETVEFRRKIFDITATSNEVVLANFGGSLLLSHPQSEIWIEKQEIPFLLAAFAGANTDAQQGLPEWLTISGGNGRLLLSDGRDGRWVLLGSDHHDELERRLPMLEPMSENRLLEKPPTISMKGLNLHLQAAFKLQQTLEEFAETASFSPYEEVAPSYTLRVMQSIEGMKISDGNLLVAVLAKEARKWAAILETELEKLGAIEMERHELKTVLAKSEGGCWILQGGDEICLSQDEQQRLFGQTSTALSKGRFVAEISAAFTLILDKATGACVALNEPEFKHLQSY